MYVETVRNLPAEAMQIIRKIENVKRKIIKCKWSMVFNDTCINLNKVLMMWKIFQNINKVSY